MEVVEPQEGFSLKLGLPFPCQELGSIVAATDLPDVPVATFLAPGGRVLLVRTEKQFLSPQEARMFRRHAAGQMFAAVHPHFLPRKNHALVRGASAGHSGDQALGGPLLCSGACSRRCFSIQNITTGSCWPRCRCQRDGKVRSVCRQCAVCRACERCISESEHLQRQFTQVLAPALKVFPWTGLWDATSAFEASLPPPGCLPSPGSGRSL